MTNNKYEKLTKPRSDSGLFNSDGLLLIAGLLVPKLQFGNITINRNSVSMLLLI